LSLTSVLLIAVAIVAAATVLGWAVAHWHLRGADLSAYDGPVGKRFSRGDVASEEALAVVASLGGMGRVLEATPMRERTAAMRKYMDEIFASRSFDARFIPADAGGVKAEWVLSPGADPMRRTLYIHGGGFIVGSPRSHRTLTTQFSALTGGVVLAIDYRLMPEHPRRAGIEDCRIAYRWLLANGPDGAAPAQVVFVAGDSAGGNLTLSLIAWARDSGLRAPDAVVALSPLTDATLASPSIRANIRTDPMLGPLFGKMASAPRGLMLWLGWVQTRINPSDPLVSPVRGDLSRLPPVLVQASEVEMLHDDARRYVNKARSAGSAVQLQTWNHMVHVWQIFNPELTEARDALAEIGRFLADASPRPAPSPPSRALPLPSDTAAASNHTPPIDP
jgi:acetyl esterase/lipase